MYGLAVVVAPTLGPTLGGWITDNYDWRWIFFINVPVALLSLFLTNRFVEDTDAIKKEVADAKKCKFRFDYLGFGLVALAFGSLEVVLDKGQEDDWFGSHFITVFFWLFILGLVGFVAWGIWRIKHNEKPILDLGIFLNRNIAVSFVLMFTVGAVLYCTLTMLPQLMQTDLGYTAQLSGEALTAGGFALILCMPIVGVLVGKVDARWMIVGGFMTLAGSLYLSTNINLQMTFGYIAELRVFQSLGLAFLFIPVNTLSYVGVRPDQSNDVSGLINLARNVGGSCGTALFASMVSRRSQVHQHYLMRYANDGHPAYVARIAALTQQAMAKAGNMVDARHHALAQFYYELQRQASILSYIDIISLLALISLAVVPLPLLLKKPPKGAAAVAH
jgi:DHA2 family multidrug resistance protein